MEHCNDPDALCVILGRTKSFIVNHDLIFHEHLEDFVSRIMRLTSYEYSMVSTSLIIIQPLDITYVDIFIHLQIVES